MKFLALAAAALLSLTTALGAQTTAAPAQPATAQAQPTSPAKHKAPKPTAEEAPGGGPDQVWVNLTSSVYHCPGSRYYGKTSHGRYMTEPAAKAAGAKPSGGKPCPAK